MVLFQLPLPVFAVDRCRSAIVLELVLLLLYFGNIMFTFSMLHYIITTIIDMVLPLLYILH